MKWESIKEMNLKHHQHIEIRFRNDKGEYETRCGYVAHVFGLPEGMTEIPPEYKSSYPVDPPFLEVDYVLDRNFCGKESRQHRPEDIDWLRTLTPDVQF